MINDLQWLWLEIVSGWWFEPLWKIWKSIGMIIPNIWENKIDVPNHQPGIYDSYLLRLIMNYCCTHPYNGYKLSVLDSLARVSIMIYIHLRSLVVPTLPKYRCSRISRKPNLVQKNNHGSNMVQWYKTYIEKMNKTSQCRHVQKLFWTKQIT